MKYKIIMDSSSNIFDLEQVSFSSVPLKIITDQKEFTDDPKAEGYQSNKASSAFRSAPSKHCSI